MKPLLILALAFLISGCIDMEQDIYLYSDGSGRIRFDMGINKDLTELGEEPGQDEIDLAENFKKIARRLLSDPRLSSSPRVEEYSDRDYRRVAIDITLRDWHDLPDINRTIIEHGTEGDVKDPNINGLLLFSLEEREDGSVTYRQPVAPSYPGVSGSEEEGGWGKFTRYLVNTFMGEGALTVTLHSPTISYTNGLWQTDRTSVQWSVELADLITESAEIESFTAAIGASARTSYLWRVLGILLIVSALVGLLVWFRRSRSRKPPLSDTVT